jgi:Lysine-specific metallo-endopeptidase
MGITFVDNYAMTQCMQFRDPIMDALSTAADRVRGGQADAACLRWFGDNSQIFKNELVRKITRFRSVINVSDVTVGFERLASRDRTTNAGAFPAAIGNAMNLGTALAHVPGGREVVELDEAFVSLPHYLPTLPGGTVDDTGYNQSRFETLVHELSHAIIGTIDDLWHGKDAYGAKRSSRLAAHNPAAAKNNAENWGVFIEACGHNRSS